VKKNPSGIANGSVIVFHLTLFL